MIIQHRRAARGSAPVHDHNKELSCEDMCRVMRRRGGCDLDCKTCPWSKPDRDTKTEDPKWNKY